MATTAIRWDCRSLSFSFTVRPVSRSKAWCIGTTLVTVIGAISAYWMTVRISWHAPMILEPRGGPVPIVSDFGGLVQRVYVTEGSTVRAGDPLVQLDVRDLIRRKHILESQIHRAELHAKGSRLDLVRRTITSPSDGRIMSLVRLNRGDRLLPGIAIGVVTFRKVASD
jgi:multidrug resistance efflux pump